MFKIKDRIAILYSAITIILIILCSALFLFLLNYSVYNKPIIEDITQDINSHIKRSVQNKGVEIENKNESYNEDGTQDIIIIHKDIRNVTNSLESEKENEEVKITDKSEPYDKDTINFTANSFEEIIIKNFYHRLFIVMPIGIAIILTINFILSKRYALFALKPLNKFTKKIKEQRRLKPIELIELPKVKDEIYDLAEAYNEVIGEIKESYGNLQRLNSYASHELRNSLSVLRAKVELGEDCKDINKYIDKLNGTIGDILAMSTNSLSSNQEDVDLALVCAKVVDEYSIIFDKLEFNIPDEGVEMIKGIEIWIERCIINLIDNAIKFMDKNKDNNKICINIFQNSNEVIIEIYDNGIGIEEDKLEKIFAPYYGTKSRVSTGIGLAYIKHIMNLHKGRVLVESDKGKYTKFSLIFIKQGNEDA